MICFCLQPKIIIIIFADLVQMIRSSSPDRCICRAIFFVMSFAVETIHRVTPTYQQCVIVAFLSCFFFFFEKRVREELLFTCFVWLMLSMFNNFLKIGPSHWIEE